MMSEQPPFGFTVCGIEELDGHGPSAPTHVLSILDPDRAVPEAFGQYDAHRKLELRFHDIIDPKEGQVLPTAEDVAAILAFGRDMPADGSVRLLVHCHAGISRSTAAMALIIAQAMPDTPAEVVLRMVHDIREKAWPNLRMIELGDRALGRGGALTEAAFALYHLQIEKRPHVAEYMEKDGRGREVQGARSRNLSQV